MGKKLKRPKSIAVGGHRYKIKLVSGYRGNQGKFGQCNSWEEILRIDAETLQKTKIFWHEVLHAIDHVFCNEQIEENNIDALAEGLYQATKSIGIDFDWDE